ncbi:MAG: CRISPR-associated endoribonuclease Cas6 [Halobacteria archaeon]|nr:CRISPR-associated endoribonuclease Cas6 [Halobacteria archaeon]
MRLLLNIESQSNSVYDTTYHNKLRGRIWQALRNTPFDSRHDTNDPAGITFSNIFPWGDLDEGEERQLLVSSPEEESLTYIAEDVQKNPEFNIGEMSFKVTDLSALEVDVGEPGSEGVIETATGTVVRLYEKHREEYGIETDENHGDTPTYWRKEHGIKPFKDAIQDNLQHKHDLFASDYLPGVTETDEQLFESYELIKTYSLPLTVTTGKTIDVILSKWRFEYEVSNEDHRRHLNLALDTGIGGRNGYGLGFCNIRNP